MKSKLVGLTILAVLICAGLWASRKFSNRHIILENPHGTTLMPASHDFADQIGEAIDLNSTINAKGVAPNCAGFWSFVLIQKMSVWFESVDAKGFAHSPDCTPVESPAVGKVADIIPTSCSGEKKGCHQALLDYRARLADFLSGEQKNYADMPMPLLLSKVYAQTLLDPSEVQKPLDEYLSMVDAVNKRRPRWLSGRKLSVLALYTREMLEADEDLKAQVSAKLDTEIESAKTLSKEDPFILGVESHRQDQGEEPAPKFVAPNVLEW